MEALDRRRRSPSACTASSSAPRACTSQSVVDPAESTFYDQYDQTAYWCVMTQTGFGPDREPVRPDVCCGGRGCCQFCNGEQWP